MRSTIMRSAAGGLCFALCAAADQTGAGASTGLISLDCGTAPESLCAALAEAISAKANQNGQNSYTIRTGQNGRKGGLHVALRLTRSSPAILEGHLEWSRPDMAPVSGPSVEVSAVDHSLNSRSHAAFARGLLQVSDLPL